MASTLGSDLVRMTMISAIENNQALCEDIEIESKEEAGPRVNAATLLLDDNAASQRAMVKYW